MVWHVACITRAAVMATLHGLSSMFGDTCIRATAPRPFEASGCATSDLPAWVADAVAEGATLGSCSVVAGGVSGRALEVAAERAFTQALAQLGGAPTRVWCFTPRITDPDQDGLNRYMRMNIGRAAAYSGRVDPMAPPAGTGVGHAGSDLVVHAIRLQGDSRSIENPRQRPAWQYSARFGPCPPPFARATAVGPWVLASGTAAVVGETSMHQGDAHAQWFETMRNLESLAAAAGLPGPWGSMTAYVSSAHVHDRLVAALPSGALGTMERIIIAPLCREELLVEIEGAWHG